MVYLDRVETAAPPRFYLHPGSLVPVHWSASGNIFLAQMSPVQRRRVLTCAARAVHRRDPDGVAATRASVRHDGFAIDDKEFLPGLLCIAVQVPAEQCSPIARMSGRNARSWPPGSASMRLSRHGCSLQGGKQRFRLGVDKAESLAPARRTLEESPHKPPDASIYGSSASTPRYSRASCSGREQALRPPSPFS